MKENKINLLLCFVLRVWERALDLLLSLSLQMSELIALAPVLLLACSWDVRSDACGEQSSTHLPES